MLRLLELLEIARNLLNRKLAGSHRLSRLLEKRKSLAAARHWNFGSSSSQLSLYTAYALSDRREHTHTHTYVYIFFFWAQQHKVSPGGSFLRFTDRTQLLRTHPVELP